MLDCLRLIGLYLLVNGIVMLFVSLSDQFGNSSGKLTSTDARIVVIEMKKVPELESLVGPSNVDAIGISKLKSVIKILFREIVPIKYTPYSVEWFSRIFGVFLPSNGVLDKAICVPPSSDCLDLDSTTVEAEPLEV